MLLSMELHPPIGEMRFEFVAIKSRIARHHALIVRMGALRQTVIQRTQARITPVASIKHFQNVNCNVTGAAITGTKRERDGLLAEQVEVELVIQYLPYVVVQVYKGSECFKGASEKDARTKAMPLLMQCIGLSQQVSYSPECTLAEQPTSKWRFPLVGDGVPRK